MRLRPTDLPEDVIQQYTLRNKVTKDGYIYLTRNPGAEIIRKILNAKGYKQSVLIPVFWTHATHPISFTLCVDNFGEKYECKKHAQHLTAILEEH